ncbi:MAG: hypothetical protein K6F43_03255 [Prevotella sp.]|nr:hypothetical protein [Prevotella sp.]
MPYTDVWAGTSQSVEIFTTAVEPGDISIQFKSTGSTILALHQMVIVESQKGVYIQGGRKVAVK